MHMLTTMTTAMAMATTTATSITTKSTLSPSHLVRRLPRNAVTPPYCLPLLASKSTGSGYH